MKRLKFLKSLKFRLFLLLLAFGILPNIVLRAGLLKSYENRAVANRSIDILSQAKILGTQIVNNDYLNQTDSEIIGAQLEQLSSIYDGRVLVVNSGFQIVKDTYNLDTGRTIISEEVVKSFKGEEISKHDFRNRYIEMTIPLTDNKTKAILGVMLASVSTDSIVDNSEYLAGNALVIEIANGILVAALAVLCSILLVGPFGRMTKSIDEIQSSEREEALSISDYAETESISHAFNQMIKRMRVIDQSRQEFVSNVSHELKTPLTSMKVLADSLLGQEEVPAENINELLELILRRLKPIAEKKDVELVLESFRPVTAEIDEVKLTLALTNLVENAIKYNKESGWVHVSLNADHKYFFVRVEDSGIGIPEDSLEHIYERFYRVDKSHSREIGGTGLGLAITRSAILMHRGAIKVHSREGDGTIFTVRIPLNYMA